MTAFAIVLLRNSGLPSTNERIKAGIAWLKSQQRASGRWWMRSLYKDTYHYTSYIATAQALQALAVCDELPVSAPDPAKELVRKVLDAAGGEDKLLTRFKMDERFNSGPKRQLPGKTRTSILPMPGRWWLGKKERGAEPAKVTAWAWTLGVLTNGNSKIELLRDVKESDVELSGLRITGSVDPALDMYFNRDNQQLVRIDWRKDIYLFSEWKDFAGTRYPTKCVMQRRQSRKPWFHHEIHKLERLRELPEHLKPAPSK